jgi:hypothetical protein
VVVVVVVDDDDDDDDDNSCSPPPRSLQWRAPLRRLPHVESEPTNLPVLDPSRNPELAYGLNPTVNQAPTGAGGYQVVMTRVTLIMMMMMMMMMKKKMRMRMMMMMMAVGAST